MKLKVLIFALLLTLNASLNAQHAVNVREYGALGDGKNNDTAAIVKAIKTACGIIDSNSPKASRKVFIPSGKYRITSPIQLTPEYNGLHIYGSRGKGKMWSPSSTTLLWDGPEGGNMFQLRAMKALRLETISLNGNKKANRLLRINSIDPQNKDKKWIKKYGQMASTGHYISYVSFSNAKIGISLSDDCYICSDCSNFLDLNFKHLEIGIEANSHQNLCYLILRPNIGYVNTAFKFNGGGAVDAINVNSHHTDLLFDISKCGINSGVYNLSMLRPEQGGKTKGKRPTILKASGEVNITITAAQTTAGGVLDRAADFDTPAFILGPSANVLVLGSQICGTVAKLTGRPNDAPTFLTFQNCRFRCLADPFKSIETDQYSGFRLRDCQLFKDEIKDGKYRITGQDFVYDYLKKVPAFK